jgi:hypothetical protein
MATVADVRRLAATLPLSYEALVGGRVKFRVGRIVYLSFSRDETVMGFLGRLESRGRRRHADQVRTDLPEPGRHVGVVGELVGGLGLAVGEELAADAVYVG